MRVLSTRAAHACAGGCASALAAAGAADRRRVQNGRAHPSGLATDRHVEATDGASGTAASTGASSAARAGADLSERAAALMAKG